MSVRWLVRKLVGWSYFWISIAPGHFCATVVFDDPPAMLRRLPPSPRRLTPSPRRSPPSPSFFEPKCIFPKCNYPKCIFAKCTRLACLLSFASLFPMRIPLCPFPSLIQCQWCYKIPGIWKQIKLWSHNAMMNEGKFTIVRFWQMGFCLSSLWKTNGSHCTMCTLYSRIPL